MKKFRITRSRGWNRPRNGFILTLSFQSFLPSISFLSSLIFTLDLTLNLIRTHCQKKIYPQHHVIFLSPPILPSISAILPPILIVTHFTQCFNSKLYSPPRGEGLTLFPYPYELYPKSYPWFWDWINFIPSRNFHPWPDFYTHPFSPQIHPGSVTPHFCYPQVHPKCLLSP